MNDAVRIFIETIGGKEALTDLSSLKAFVSELNNEKIKLQIDSLGLTGQEKALNSYQQKVNGIAQRAAKLRIGELREEEKEQRSLLNLERERLRTAELQIQTISRGFQTAGNLSTFLGSFSGKIADSFSQMSQLFSTNITEQIGKTFVDTVTRSIMGNMSNIFTRVDILNTFSDYMSLMDISKFDSSQALNRVDLSIRGLPIGLDEAAQRLRRYTMLSNDLERATNITIGIQKAITAGGASAQMKNTAYLQMDRLMSVGKLTTSRQWMALINGLGTSARFVAEAMGLEGFTGKDLVAGLLNHDIETDSFLDAIAALGEGTIDAAKKLDEALSIYKSTYESWWTNIQFAFIRGGANVVNAISESLQTNTGHSIVGYMEIFRDSINKLFSGAAAWVGNNGDVITKVMDSIRNLFSVFRDVGAGDLAGKILDNFARAINLIASVVDQLSTSKMGDFLAFAMTLAGPLGKLFKLLGQGLPVLMGVFERFKRMDFESIVDALIRSMEAFAKAVTAVLNVIPDSALTFLMSFALVWGKPLGAVLTGIGGALRSLGREAGGYGSIRGGLDVVVGGIRELVGALGGAGALLPGLATGGILFGLMHVIDYAERGVREANKLAEEATGLTALRRVITELGLSSDTALTNSDAAEAEIKKQLANAELTNDLVDEIIKINDKYPHFAVDDVDGSIYTVTEATEEETAKLKADIAILNSIYPAWNLMLDENTGVLDANSRAILANAGALEQAAIIASQEDALTTNYTSYYTELGVNKRLRSENSSYMAKWRTWIADRYNAIQMYRAAGYEYDPNVPLENLPNFPAVLEANGIDSTEFFARRDALEKQKEELAKQLLESDNRLRIYRRRIEDLRKAIGDAIESEADDLNKAKILEELNNQEEAVKALAERYAELKTSAKESLDSMVEGFGKLEKIEPNSVWKIFENLEARRQMLEQMDTNVNKLIDYANNTDDQNTIDFIAHLLSDPSTYAAEIYGVANYLASGNTEMLNKIVSDWVNNGQLSEATAQAIATFLGTQEDELIGAVEESKAKIDELVTDGLHKALVDTENTVQDAVDYLNSLDVEARSAGHAIMDAFNAGLIDEEEAVLITARIIGEKAARLLAEAFNITYTPVVNITPSVRVNQPGVPIVGPERLLRQNGGIVPDYLARGGWPSRGTDTVPAMLTPGEFVQKRAAVEMFGKKFMERVNALDIGGSIDAMSRKFGLPFMGGPFVNTSNVRDNHATVNQTNITNNQNFTYKKAFRFASGLA